MGNQEKNNAEYYTIDLLHVAKALWKRAWIIVLCGLLCAAIGFVIAAYAIAPSYAANVKLYVNNSSFSLGNASFSISSSELTAAQSLLKTYGEILNSRSTLERIIDKADVDYSWKELSKMISYQSANGTEIMAVTVTSGAPKEACTIANVIADVLPVRITEIIDGASMEVVDLAVVDNQKIAPSVSKYTAGGLIIGILLAAMVIALLAVLDGTIHDEEYILQNYDYPILGKVPDLLRGDAKAYGYYAAESVKGEK